MLVTLHYRTLHLRWDNISANIPQKSTLYCAATVFLCVVWREEQLFSLFMTIINIFQDSILNTQSQHRLKNISQMFHHNKNAEF